MRRRGVGLYRNAICWFALLLIILIVGFCWSYFSQIGQGSLHITHHVHGVAMLLWVLRFGGSSRRGPRAFGAEVRSGCRA